MTDESLVRKIDPDSLTLSRTSKGSYSYEAKIYCDLKTDAGLAQALTRLDDIDKQLVAKYSMAAKTE